MLETLRIRNYALIEEVELEFGPGFNVLTGETGAGKSIIVGALNLVLGARASSDAVRAGQEQARVEAVFRLPKPSKRLRAILDEHGIELEDGALLVARAVNADGRSKAYCGGNLTPLAVLSAVGDELVDLHGQHEHQSLLKLDRQLDLLDAFTGTEDAAVQVAGKVAQVRRIDQEIASLEADDRDRARQVEFMEFELAEIDKANLQAGEEEELRARRNLITNAETIVQGATTAYALLYEAEEGTALQQMGGALLAIEDLALADERFRPLAAQLREATVQVEAIAEELRAYTDAPEYDPAELDALNTRLSLIRDLQRKYGATVEAVLAYADEARAQVEAFAHRDERLGALRREREQAHKDALEAAGELSKKRMSGARRLKKRVTDALQDLGMKGAAFEVVFEAVALCRDGIDRVEFYLAANAGEKAKPLRQVASGGEVSRIMLALKAVFAEVDRIPTLIFDEIDAGVGGNVANRVAEKMAALADSRQVLSITHLPQIAAAADTHFHVAKSEARKRTTTTVARIEGDGRVEEIARLLDGATTPLSLEHARALLKAS